MSQNIDLQILAGDYVKKAYIAEWKVQEGDAVKKGDVLLSCETGKLTVDIEAPCDGIVERILFPAGEEVDISETVAVIGDGSGMAAAVTPPTDAVKEASTTPAAGKAEKRPGRVFVSPVALKVAKELGIDVEAMKEAVGKTKISKDDVYAYAESLKNKTIVSEDPPASAADAVREIPVKGRRRAIAQKMSESTSSKPRVVHMMDVDLEEMMKVKQYLARRFPDKQFTLTGLLAVAVCKALKAHPHMNATYENETIREHREIRLGIAVDMEGGLIVPVVAGGENKSGIELCQAVGDTVSGCRNHTLPPSAYMGGTFTITNLGGEGVRYFTPIMNAPEVAILGVGSMFHELVLDNGQVAERRRLGLCLTFDHRAVDGAPAAKFLKTIKEYVENPFLLGF